MTIQTPTSNVAGGEMWSIMYSPTLSVLVETIYQYSLAGSSIFVIKCDF